MKRKFKGSALANARFESLLVFLLGGAATIVACGDEEEPEQVEGAVGAECKPRAGCDEPLECTKFEDTNRCTFPAGGECTPEDEKLENGGCSQNAECVVGEDPAVGTCLLLEGEECDPEQALCTEGLVCAEMVSEGHRCFAPISLVGTVSDSSDAAGIRGAHVIAIDSEGSAATSVAESDAEGHYSLEVPVPRNEDGSPVDVTFTLSGSAQDYQPFPSGVRVALPIATSDAQLQDGGWVVSTTLTDLALIPLPPAQRHSISGVVTGVELDDEGRSLSDVTGVLVVASDGDRSFSATTDKDGAFTIFNVEDGDYDVSAYGAELQVTSKTTSVAGGPVNGLVLQENESATVTVDGNVQIVNAGGGSMTSVILVVADTFDATTARGEVPRGLRAPRTGVPDISGDFQIGGVPDGTYVVLAAYENDSLVRDPDTNIAGTDFVTVTISSSAGATHSISDSFKVTEALEILGPGADAPEAVAESPTLRWVDDSSEDFYELRVFDAFGDEVWSKLDVPAQSGAGEVSVEYGGPLEPGMYYQFRALSIRQPGGGTAAPISTTEDLRGVFFKPAN